MEKIGGWLLDVDPFDGFNVLLQLAFLLVYIWVP